MTNQHLNSPLGTSMAGTAMINLNHSVHSMGNQNIALGHHSIVAGTSVVQQNCSYSIDQAIAKMIDDAFSGKRGNKFCSMLTEHFWSKNDSTKLKAMANIFSDDAINSYVNYDNDELFNYLVLTV